VCAQLGPDDVLLVTADHGQVSVGDDLAPPHADVLSNVAYQSGTEASRRRRVDPNWSSQLRGPRGERASCTRVSPWGAHRRRIGRPAIGIAGRELTQWSHERNPQRER
jgi:hypothetical protein